MPFPDELLVKARPIWDAMLQHRFLKETAEGRIEDTVFATWMQQDYLYVQGAISFISVLVSRAPVAIRSPLASALAALQGELDLFQQVAAGKNISFQDLKITPTCHAYVQFMLSTAHAASFEEGFTLLYGTEKAYFDCWSWVRQNLKVGSPWQPFIERWSDESFRQWVSWIAATLDALATHASPSLRERMTEIFLLTGQYELLFWDMAAEGEAWPVEMR